LILNQGGLVGQVQGFSASLLIESGAGREGESRRRFAVAIALPPRSLGEQRRNPLATCAHGGLIERVLGLLLVLALMGSASCLA